MGFIMWETEYSTIWGRFLFSIPFLLGGLAGALVFSHGVKRRPRFFLRAAGCVVACCIIVFFLWPAASRSGKWAILICAYLFQFILIVASVLICNRCSVSNALFYAENGIAAFSIVKLLFDCVGVLTIAADISIRPYGALYSILYGTIGMLVYFLLYLLLRKQSKTALLVDRTKLLLPTSVVLAVSIVFNIALGKFINAYSLQADVIVAFKILLLLCCLLVLFINFDVFTINRQRHEMDTIVQLNKKQQEQFAFSQANVESLNRKYHDLKGMIGSLRKLADANIGESIKEAESEVEAYDSIAKTGNRYLDVLLTERSIYCERNGIRFTYLVDGDALSFMQPMDLISFFDNCTANAIEAVMKLPDSEKRVISLQCSKRHGMLAIRCDNFFNGELRASAGLPSTSKRNAAEHGYGLKSMQMIAKKYGGSLTVSAREDIFRLSAVLPCG